MSQSHNPVPAWILQLQIVSAGALFCAALCFYGFFRLSDPLRFALIFSGIALGYVAWAGWLVARIVKQHETRLNQLGSGRLAGEQGKSQGEISSKDA